MKSLIMAISILIGLSLPTMCFGMVDVKVVDAKFIRGQGAPVTESRSFPGLSGVATIEVINGSLEDSTVEKVSSSVIKVNGNVIFTNSDFNQNVQVLQKGITLSQGQNNLEVLLKSKPGGTRV